LVNDIILVAHGNATLYPPIEANMPPPGKKLTSFMDNCGLEIINPTVTGDRKYILWSIRLWILENFGGL